MRSANPLSIRHRPLSHTAFVLLAVVLTLGLPPCPAHAAVSGAKSFRVVIDPGHGGNDFGTLHDDGHLKFAEKDITLTLGLQITRKLRAKGFFVALTREADQDVPLGQRTALANRIGADVFLSIHMNAGAAPRSTAAEGVETYILNNATDATSKRLAHLENTVLPAHANDTPEQVDVALILRDLRLDANLPESKRLACVIQQNLVDSTTVVPGILNAVGPRALARNRGVKQALFHVLLGAEMPSVLLEAGFLSSARDRAVVLSPQGQDRIASAVAKSIAEFKSLKGTRQASLALSRCKVH